MIVSRIIGGLGNQLFQYAFGYAAALEKGSAFSLETASFGHYGLRDYKLDRFRIDAPVLADQELLVSSRTDDGHTTGLKGFTTLYERKIPPDFSPNLVPDDSFLIGYWQKYVYFDPLRSEIIRQFKLVDDLEAKNQKLSDQINSSNSVAVHVRRGDYVSNRRTKKIHGPLGPNYYREAVAEMLHRFENVTAFVFSDDPAWVRANLRFPCPTVFVDHNGPALDHEELAVMTACNHFIIANSTFSWWPAYLSASAQKVVISPKNWFADPKRRVDGLIPPHWISLDSGSKHRFGTFLRSALGGRKP